MTFPAFTEFAEDPGRTYSRWCVYMALQPPFLSFTEPRDVKIAVVKARARVGYGRVAEALQWLEQRGYLIVHQRDRRGMPSITLAYARYEHAAGHDAGQVPMRNNLTG